MCVTIYSNNRLVTEGNYVNNSNLATAPSTIDIELVEEKVSHMTCIMSHMT